MGDEKSISSVISQCLFTLLMETVSHWPGTHSTGRAYWSLNYRGPSASSSPVLGLQAFP